MKTNLLDLIICPACSGILTVSEDERRNDEIWMGALLCASCSASYPIQSGMPHLYSRDERWVAKEIEALGWVALHRELGIYDVTPDPVDLKIPYYPEDPWISVARSFDIAQQLLQLTGQEVVLDLGAGRGWAAKQFALLGCSVLAVDVVADENVGLGRGQALMHDAGVYFERMIADGENLPFLPDQFDLVFCAASLHHFSDLPLLMRQIGRVLKPGGRLCAINEPCRAIVENEQDILRRDASAELDMGINETRPSLAEYYTALKQAGLLLRPAFPPTAATMNLDELRNWAVSLSAARPSFRIRPVRQQLMFWRRYLANRIKLTKRGRIPDLEFAAPDERTSLETAVLHWVAGEMILLAEKPL